MNAMIIPGNGNADMSDIWFPSVKKSLEAMGLHVIAENMPDPELARKQYWLPFIESKMGAEPGILIGHSSGAVAILRYLETHTCELAVLVGVCYTDLGDEMEKLSGYYEPEFNWDVIKTHAKRMVIFNSTDDPYIPISEARYVAEKLGAEYHEFTDRGHFHSQNEFPELLQAVQNFLNER